MLSELSVAIIAPVKNRLLVPCLGVPAIVTGCATIHLSISMKTNRKLLKWFLILALTYAVVTLWLSTALDPTPENLTLAVSITLSGLYTLLLYLLRWLWLPWFQRDRMLWAILVGIFNAAFIEALFLAVEKIFGAEGVAAHPNLLVDWLLTMPWYVGMVMIFVWVQKRRQFPLGAVLLLGAVYESGADGFVGGLVVPLIAGPAPDVLGFCVFMPLLAFWQFIPVYSSMVLIPALILKEELPVGNTPWKSWQAFLPLIWLIPFTVYVILALLLLVGG